MVVTIGRLSNVVWLALDQAEGRVVLFFWVIKIQLDQTADWSGSQQVSDWRLPLVSYTIATMPLVRSPWRLFLVVRREALWAILNPGLERHHRGWMQNSAQHLLNVGFSTVPLVNAYHMYIFDDRIGCGIGWAILPETSPLGRILLFLIPFVSRVEISCRILTAVRIDFVCRFLWLAYSGKAAGTRIAYFINCRL